MPSGAPWNGATSVRPGEVAQRPSPGSVERPLEYYFGATGGGLWKTTDGGLKWDP